MPDHGDPVKTYPEPQLFSYGGLAVSLEALCDSDDQTVVFVVRTVDVVEGRLVALWSSSPRGFEELDKQTHVAYREFVTQLRDATSPFP